MPGLFEGIVATRTVCADSRLRDSDLFLAAVVGQNYKFGVLPKIGVCVRSELKLEAGDALGQWATPSPRRHYVVRTCDSHVYALTVTRAGTSCGDSALPPFALSLSHNFC